MYGDRRLPDGVEMTFRPATLDDLAYCYRIYADGLRDHVDTLFGWNDANQQSNFASVFRPEESRIICGRIGESHAEVGWIQAAEEINDVHVKELHIMRGSRGLGLGAWALNQIIIDATARHKGVRLSVLVGSPAVSFYKRLGFEATGSDEHMICMRRSRV